MTVCPCGSQKIYSACCGLYIDNAVLPPTPEALMRSRYTAYSQANIDYIAQTMKGRAAQGFNISNALQWAQQVQWLRLEVIKVSPLTNSGKLGHVEFIAHFRLQGKAQRIHEVSEFHLENGRWYYVDGKLNVS